MAGPISRRTLIGAVLLAAAASSYPSLLPAGETAAMNSMPQESLDRINMHRLGPWLPAFFNWLGQGQPNPDTPPGERVVLVSRERGVTATVFRRGDRPAGGDVWSDWVLERVMMNATVQPVPFGLNLRAETPDSAVAKLSNDRVFGPIVDPEQGGRQISYFLDDARVIELTFGPHDAGITRIFAARLGAEQEWPGDGEK